MTDWWSRSMHPSRAPAVAARGQTLANLLDAEFGNSLADIGGVASRTARDLAPIESKLEIINR